MVDYPSIPYTRSDGTRNIARIVPVDAPLADLDRDEMQVIGHLSLAMDGLAPIIAQQNHPDTIPLLRAVQFLEAAATGEERERLGAYATILAISCSPFDHMGGLGYAGDLLERYPKELGPFARVLAPSARQDPRAGVYPLDMADAEFDALAPEWQMLENSTVSRDADGALRVRRNEERFAGELADSIASLRRARPYARDERLVGLIDAKINELRTGTQDARVRSDIAWIANQGRVDFVLSTALETYIDGYKSIRGCAQGGVFVASRTYDDLTARLRAMIPRWRAQAPWDRRKDGESAIPQLRFVDVVRWNGGYDLFPGCVKAESLPNDTQVADRHGRVNLIFVNVQNASGGASREVVQDLLPGAVQHLAPLLQPMYLSMTAAHELGHSIGPVLPEEDWKREFGADGHVLEEARAEVFSQWVLPSMREAGLITPEQEIAGHYSMLLTCLRSLEMPPKNHRASRNMMLHRYLETGAVREFEEGGRLKYLIDMNRIDATVADLLRDLGTLKTNLDGAGFCALKDRYCRSERQEEFKQRFARFPSAVGLVFPDLVRDGRGRFTGKADYPVDFRSQSRSLARFV